MSYKFGGRLFRNSAEMHHAIAEQWLSAGGANTTDDMYEALDRRDSELADEAISAWDLSEYADDDPGPRGDLPRRYSEFSRVALIKAFAHIRDNFRDLYLDEDH